MAGVLPGHLRLEARQQDADARHLARQRAS